MGGIMPKLIQDQENVLFTRKKVSARANRNHYILDLILTNERLILLQDKAKQYDYVNILSSRGLQVPEELEVVFTISLLDILITYEDDINYITFKDNNNLLEIDCEDLNKYIN